MKTVLGSNMVPLASFVDQLPETERQKLTERMMGTIPEERMTQFTSFGSSFRKLINIIEENFQNVLQVVKETVNKYKYN